MSYKKVTIEGKKLPISLTVEILQRAIGDTAVISLYEQYINNRKTIKSTTPPTAKQYHLASLAKEVGTVEAASKAGAQFDDVNYAITRVARYTYLYGEPAQ